MPRATWKGFLRLSLVTCPVYLLPAATKTKSIRLHQVWVPRSEPMEPAEDETDELPPPRRGARDTQPAPPLPPPDFGPATRIALQPVDRGTGEAVEREEVVKGYEFDRGQFVTFTPQELKALDVGSSRTIDLITFVPRADIDPVYFNAPYYVHPDGAVASEAFHVIGAAMADAGVAGIGRVTMSRRERAVMVEPRAAGMLLMTLRSAEEVRRADFGAIESDIDPDMVASAEAIIRRRIGTFDPATFRDRYQEALKELIEAKLKGRRIAPAPEPEPSQVIDLMAALKRSLAQETGAENGKKARAVRDRRQTNLLLPVRGKAPREAATPMRAGDGATRRRGNRR